MTPREKSPVPEKFSSDEDGTHDPASCRTTSSTHYQRAIPAPRSSCEVSGITQCREMEMDPCVLCSRGGHRNARPPRQPCLNGLTDQQTTSSEITNKILCRRRFQFFCLLSTQDGIIALGLWPTSFLLSPQDGIIAFGLWLTSFLLSPQDGIIVFGLWPTSFCTDAKSPGRLAASLPCFHVNGLTWPG